MNDQILFWISPSFTHFCLAKFIQDKHNADLYAIIDTTNKPKKFFEKQKIVSFNQVWFYHDNIDKSHKLPNLDYLEEFEARYKIPLSELAFNERLFTDFNEFYQFSSNEILSIVEQECRTFEKIIDQVKPNFVIMNKPYFHHEMIFYKLCKSKGIKVLDFSPTNYSTQAVLSFEDELENYTNFHPKKPSRTFDEMREFHKKYHIFKQNYAYRKEFQSSKKDLFNAAMKFLFSQGIENSKTHYTYFGRNRLNVLTNYILNSLKVRFRKNFIDKNFLNNIKETENLILFPLQVEAESSLLLNAPLFTNQIEIIKQIAKSIPINYKLMVKEHPSSGLRSWRSIKEYKDIMNIPNVLLFHPEANTEELIKKSSLVISIGSTTALDALFFEKPSILLSDNMFSVIPSIQKIKDPKTFFDVSQLRKAISESLKTQVRPEDLDKHIQFCEKISFPFNPFGLGQSIQKFFHYGGFLVDVEITENEMKLFLEESKDLFEKLSDVHIEKMKTFGLANN